MVKKDDELIKILLADDNENDLLLFRKALKEAELNVKLKAVKDGFKLMKELYVAGKNFPDIIFLNINMPHQNGKQCLREIRGNKKFPEIPVVMFCTSVNVMDMIETFADGANLYVAKPLFFKNPVAVLQKIFAQNWQENLLKKDKKKFEMFLAEKIVFGH
ncbi:MAG TPA: response regulator [Bacteroidia bacterium]|nr:response regulator [Bacteroidia bacterium]